MNISIQGIKGAFHEEAAQLYFSKEISIVEQMTFEEVISSVEIGKADAGILAIENTISGTIHSNYELIKNSSLHIVGEVYLKIEQHLAVNKGVNLQELTMVESHYMAIEQCRDFFTNHSHITLNYSDDTALSMKTIRHTNQRNTGAIGSSLAAKHYGLDVLASGIQNNKKNYTRFFIVQAQKSHNRSPNKASLNLVINQKEYTLVTLLNELSTNHIYLTKIESMPIPTKPWHYQYYIDIEFNNDQNWSNFLLELNHQTESYTILGTYQKHKTKLL